jgi:molybdate transport system regulatory protein
LLKKFGGSHLWGKISRIHDGPINAEITLTLPGCETVCAVVTRDSVDNLGLIIGEQASALTLCLHA